MTIRVEVAFAAPDEQVLLSLEVGEGTTVEEAIRQSGIAERFPQFDLGALPTGIFSVPCARNHGVADGDRIEIYRPLTQDPKESRRNRAADSRRKR